MTNNRFFGNLNGFGNGNAFGDGGNGYVKMDNNFVNGNGSASFNGNGQNGYAEIVDNRVMGDGSLSNNGNAEFGVAEEGRLPHAYGDGSVTLKNNTVLGNYSLSHNPSGTYRDNIILGDRSGSFAEGSYQRNAIIGHDSGNGFSEGAQNNFIGGNNAGNGITGNNNVAIGNGAGNGLGNDDTAVGAGATVTADHSSAFGADAVADLPNLVTWGTTAETYRAPGITSGLSKARQSGPLEVVTSDADGNLATDGGQIFGRLDDAFRRLDEANSGIAMALAVVNPDLTRDERFGISANWGHFEGANAFGMGIQGVVGHGWITKGDRVAVTGGWGVGFSDDDGDDVFGGRVGAQWTWGRVP